MAKIKRSIWEIRFKALQQEMDYKRENIKWRVVKEALGGTLPTETRQSENVRLILLNELIKRGKEIEGTPAERLFWYDD